MTLPASSLPMVVQTVVSSFYNHSKFTKFSSTIRSLLTRFFLAPCSCSSRRRDRRERERERETNAAAISQRPCPRPLPCPPCELLGPYIYVSAQGERGGKDGIWNRDSGLLFEPKSSIAYYKVTKGTLVEC